MKRKFIIVFLLLNAQLLTVLAHNAKISTFTLRDTGGGWLVEMAFAQASVHAAMIHTWGEENVNRLDRDAYRDAVITYVKEHFHLWVDGEQVFLKDGGIMLGSHQTDLKFILPEIIANPKNISVDIPMFGHVYNQTNILRIYRGGQKTTKFFLSSDNDFKVALALTEKSIVEMVPNHQYQMGLPGFMGIGLLLTLFVFVGIYLYRSMKAGRALVQNS